MNAIDVRFPDRLRRVRRFRGLTQIGLARTVGWDNAMLSKIELGNRRATIGEAAELAAALDVPLDLLTADGPLTMTVEL
jgi:transcriptional regulator with XRE-family HTH domain